MGRRPLGRKYPKHISIQVRDEHNDDLKILTGTLNKIARFQNGKKQWTIRDVILTLVYGFCRNGVDPDWFTTNHFEGLSLNDLEQIRYQLTQISRKPQRKAKSQRKPEPKKPKTSKPKERKQVLSFTINPQFEKDLEFQKQLTKGGV
ncbi:MAG: hypothetical protein ACW98K_17455 [Candidatus Kariarchaeaceae archaeon]|jgi:hypothetical protein